MRTGRRALWAAAACAAALAVAGCGSDEEETTGGQADTPAASGSAAVAAAQKELDQFRGEPKFVAPGEAFDARAAVSGKSLMNIPASSGIPFVQTMSDGLKELSGEVGMKYLEWPNQGRPVQWGQGMNSAINRKVDLITLMAGNNPASLGPQIKQANAQGIDVMAAHLYDLADTPTDGSKTLSFPYEQAGRLLADWVVTKTNGDAHTLVVKIDEVVSTKAMMKGITDVFDEACGEACPVSTINVAIADVATKIQPQVQSALLKDPKIEYVIALYDSAQAPFVVSAIKASGKSGKVKVVTFNGTPSVLKMVKAGDVEMDVAENLEWNSYAITDQAMRLIAGMEPVKDPKLPLRIYDQSNIDEAGSNPETAEGFGDAYVAGYRKLWGLDG
jgi:ribose transport system substrate-binding protein